MENYLTGDLGRVQEKRKYYSDLYQTHFILFLFFDCWVREMGDGVTDN